MGLKQERAATPTRVRYRVLGYLGALAFILYIDRICISKAAPAIQAELGISHTAMGIVFGAFTVAYGLFEIPTGRLGDRYGSRGILTRIVLWWSAFTVLTGCVWSFSLDSGYEIALPGKDAGIPLLINSFVVLVIIRFLFGAGEAGALPNTARVLARWFPDDARGSAQGLINTAMLLGGAVTPVVAAYLINWFGWRWAFVLFGLLGVVWAIAFHAWFRDDPAEHPDVNEAERELIAAGTSPRPAVHSAALPSPLPRARGRGEGEGVPWRYVLTSANVWLLGGVITCSAFASYMYFFWYPTYLEEGRGVGKLQSGWLASMVLAGGAVGCTLGGYLGDAAVRWTGSRRWGRRLVGAGGLSLAAVCLLGSLAFASPVAAAGLTALACLSACATLASWWAAVTAISGNHVGALFGLMNSLGVPGAVASQLFFGRFADVMKAQGYTGRDRWDGGFYVYAAVLLAGAVGWLLVDPTRSAVGEGKSERAATAE